MANLIRIAIRTGLVVLVIALLASTGLSVNAQSAAPAPVAAAAQQPIALPAPQITGGMPLMQALANRKTTRAFADKALSMQQLSNLLWAGFGVNRTTMPPSGPPRPPAPGGANVPGAPNTPPPAPQPPKPGRTAPSARNSQDIDLYVVLAQGVYVYDAVSNQLKPVAAGDQRAKAGSGAAGHAAATIVFVAPAKDDQFAQVDTGFIGQNIYLWAASEGLNAWFYVARNPDLPAVLNLPADKAPLYAESVGYPEK